MPGSSPPDACKFERKNLLDILAFLPQTVQGRSNVDKAIGSDEVVNAP